MTDSALPPRITAPELAALLDARARGEADFVLVDVREPWEYETVAVPGAVLVPMGELLSDKAREIMPPEEHVVIYCHHGSRSDQARAYLEQNGWDSIQDVIGGVHAYARDVDPTLPTY